MQKNKRGGKMNARDRPIDILKCLGIEFKKISDYGYMVYRKEVNMFGELNKQGNKFDYTAKNKGAFKSTIEYLKDIQNGKCENTEVMKDYEDVTLKTKDDVYPIHGYFFFETVHGDSGAIILEDVNVYIPKHLLPLFRDFTDDMDNAIRENKCGVSFYEYDSKKRADCVGIRLHDIK